MSGRRDDPHCRWSVLTPGAGDGLAAISQITVAVFTCPTSRTSRRQLHSTPLSAQSLHPSIIGRARRSWARHAVRNSFRHLALTEVMGGAGPQS